MSWVNKISSNHLRCCRFMSMYPQKYMDPVFKKNIQYKKGLDVLSLSHIPIKGALSNSSDTVFNGDVKQKMIKYMTKNGNSFLSKKLLIRTFELIKRTEVEGLYLTSECKKVVTDPEVRLIQAVENCRPLLQLSSIKRGGVKYQVPIPLTNKRSYFLAMKWLLDAAHEKDRKVSLPEKLSWEIIDAAHGQGRVIKKKEDLNRQCESNRAYAHYRWS